MIDIKKLKGKLNEYDLQKLPPSSMKFDIHLHYIYDGSDVIINGHYSLIIKYDKVSLVTKYNKIDYPTKYNDIEINSPEEFEDIMMNKIVPHIILTHETSYLSNPTLIDNDKLSIERVALRDVRSRNVIYPIEDFIDIIKHCFMQPKKPIINKYRSTAGFDRE